MKKTLKKLQSVFFGRSRQILVAALLSLSFLGLEAVTRAAEEKPTLLYFASPGCHKCEVTQARLEKLLKAGLKDKIDVEYLDISEVENYQELISLREAHKVDPGFAFPVLYLEGHFLDGLATAPQEEATLRTFVDSSLKNPNRLKTASERTDLAEHFRNLSPLTVVGAGLIDGINPCAFTAIVFFMSFLSLQGYEKKKIVAAGLTFITVTFLTYLLIGTGLFNSLYSMKAYRSVANLVNLIIGSVSLLLGVLSMRDAILFARTGVTGDIVLQLPKRLKMAINSVINKGFRLERGDGEHAHARRKMAVVIVSAAIVGFIVCLTETVCTGQIYLPTIVLVLNTAGDSTLAISYLVLYNVLFIAPLVLIFVCGLMGVTSEMFGKIVKKNMLAIKVLLASIFIILGLSLILIHFPVKEATAEAAEMKNKRRPIPLQQQEPERRLSWDFGKVKEGDVLKHSFEILNNTDKTVNILQMNTSCGCTSAKMSDNVIPPGKSVNIDAAFDTKGFPGEHRKFVYVQTDGEGMKLVLLELKATIEPR